MNYELITINEYMPAKSTSKGPSQNNTSDVVKPPPVIQPVENLDQILDSTPESSEANGKLRLEFAVGIVITIGLIVGSVVVFWIYLGSVKAPQASVHTTTTSVATPTPVFDRSQVSFEVINASGVSGAATKAKDALTQTGYTVVSVGNGKKQAKNELFVTKSLSSAAMSEILADANSLFSVSSSSGDITHSTASARIILGVQ